MPEPCSFALPAARAPLTHFRHLAAEDLHRRLDRRILHRGAGQLGGAGARRLAGALPLLASPISHRTRSGRPKKRPPAPRSAPGGRAAPGSRSGSRAAPPASPPRSSSRRTVHLPRWSASVGRSVCAKARKSSQRAARRRGGGRRCGDAVDARPAAAARPRSPAAPAPAPARAARAAAAARARGAAAQARLEVVEALQQIVDRQQRRQGRQLDQRHLQHQLRIRGPRHLLVGLEQDVEGAVAVGGAMRCAWARSARRLVVGDVGQQRAAAHLRDREVAEVLEQVAGEAAHVVAALVGVVEQRRGRAAGSRSMTASASAARTARSARPRVSSTVLVARSSCRRRRSPGRAATARRACCPRPRGRSGTAPRSLIVDLVAASTICAQARRRSGAAGCGVKS